MKILIIGGTGTISSAITRQLAESGHDLWLLNRGTRKQEVPASVKQIIADIDDVTFNNAAVAYTPNSYQLIVTPKNKKQPLHHLPLGNDGDWALQATEQLRQYLNR